MAEYTVDCLGEACPVPLMKVQKKMETMAVGDVLVAQIDHSCAMKNIPEGRAIRATTSRSKRSTTASGKS